MDEFTKNMKILFSTISKSDKEKLISQLQKKFGGRQELENIITYLVKIGEV